MSPWVVGASLVGAILVTSCTVRSCSEPRMVATSSSLPPVVVDGGLPHAGGTTVINNGGAAGLNGALLGGALGYMAGRASEPRLSTREVVRERVVRPASGYSSFRSRSYSSPSRSYSRPSFSRSYSRSRR